MDEVVHHCLRELSFDGDLGCDVSRLRDFIVSFYANNTGQHVQVIDDAFCAFVWDIVVQQPTASAKKKAKAKGEDHLEEAPPVLDLVPDANVKTLDQLKAEYGERLRIAVDPETSFVAITGSHLRPSKLSPMVYTALQFITRGRECGLTVVDLGRKSKYDQKTCFYLIKQLIDLDLVIKVKSESAISHLIIHKYFYERNPVWQQFREEEIRANTEAADTASSHVLEEPADEETSAKVDFEPMDARHLASLPLVRARIVKLLKSSESYTHPSKNMLLIIGFANPAKADRRAFQGRLRELLQQGIIEKVNVPRSGKHTGNRTVNCLRLVTSEAQNGSEDNDYPVQSAIVNNDDNTAEGVAESSGTKMNVTIHKQIIDLMEEAGELGITLNELSSALGQFDKRTIELLLTRTEKNLPPSHLSDLGVVGLMETHGRERRHRYYTVAAYRALVARENLDPSTTGYPDFTLTDAGGFARFDGTEFYENEEALFKTQDESKAHEGIGSKVRKYPPKNPILPDGTVKRGRPRKNKSDDGAKKRKRGDGPDVEESQAREKGQPHKRRKGGDDNSQPDRPTTAAAHEASERLQGNTTASQQDGDSSQAVPRKRGRARKTVSTATQQNSEARPNDAPPDGVGPSPDETPAPKRPRLSSSTADAQASPGPRTKVNVSHMRRENELYRVLENLGGIAVTNAKEFYEAHLALLETVTLAGEQTSAPVGTRLDRRTVLMTLDSLELRDRVKVIKTSVTTPTGINRPVQVAYTPDVEEEKLSTFLANLSHTIFAPSQPLSRPLVVEGTEDQTKMKSTSAPLHFLQQERPGGNEQEHWWKNEVRADQLLARDDAQVRDILLMERTTLAQIYGYIVGKAARSRKFHLHSISLFEGGTSSVHIISHEARIVHLSYYCQDLPLAIYCALLACLEYDEELLGLLGTEDGRHTPVKDLSPRLRMLLQLGKARARTRFLEVLVILMNLKLATPLVPSSSPSPWLTCAPNEQHPHHPTAFEPSVEAWSPANVTNAPLYWRFESTAPLYIWAISDGTPPFWKHSSVASYADCITYWAELETACLDREKAEETQSSGSTIDLPDAPTGLTNVLRRPASWNRGYVLTWHQCRYLRKYVDVSTGTGDTPLEDEDDDTIRHISWVVSAPEYAVREAFAEMREKSLRGLERVRRKEARQTAQDEAKRAAEAKALLAGKAAEAKLQREQAWEDMIKRLHPSGLQGSAAVCIRRVRARFLQSASHIDVGKWEAEVQEAIRATKLAAAVILRAKRPPVVTSAVVAKPPAVVTNPPEKSVEALIAQQGPARKPVKKEKKPRGKEKALAAEVDGQTKPAQRRHRFQWNREYDELARDACAIIKARCRDGQRLDLAALEQVFPSIPRNSVRQRLTALRALPGDEAYMKRLEDRWYDLWLQHRGTPLLPDDDPQHPSNFQLAKHIEFLRKHIDKSALRVGFAHTEEKSTFILPAAVDELIDHWEISSSDSMAPTYDFLWNATLEEGREKQLISLAFTTSIDEMPPVKDDPVDAVRVAEAALKLVLGTRSDVYDPDEASRLLRELGESTVQAATKNLLTRGVLSKINRKPLLRPGRALKISEMNQNAAGGAVPRDTFQDAAALEDILTGEGSGWQEWPLCASDGDATALVQLVSDNKVDVGVDISRFQAARALLDWNSKKADDDHIENAIHIRCYVGATGETISRDNSPNEPLTELEETASVHGQTKTGEIASCRSSSEGLVDCAACLEEAESLLFAALPEELASLTRKILEEVGQTGAKGVTTNTLLTNAYTSAAQIFSAVQKMTDAPTPLLFWSGYAHTVLISSTYLRSWSVVVSDAPLIRVFPRRWLNLYGARTDDVWEAALKAVVGVVIFRPGVSQTEIRWRLRAVYDRREIVDCLRSLEESNTLVRRTYGAGDTGLFPIPALDQEEEQKTFWFISNAKHWYQV